MAKDLQTILKNITQGVYVISVNDKGEKNAFTAAWVMQVSFDPLLICFSINPKHRSYSLLKKGKVCCISVLNNQQFNIAVHFGQSIPDKMSAYQWLETKSGAPALTESLAYFDCCVDNFSTVGDHEIVLCKVINAEIITPGEPMLYRDTDDMDSSSALYKK